jgi:alkylhydroperoxidase family enzyme
VWTAIQHLQKAIAASGVDPKLLALVHLRASQINSCSACVCHRINRTIKEPAGQTWG